MGKKNKRVSEKLSDALLADVKKVSGEPSYHPDRTLTQATSNTNFPPPPVDEKTLTLSIVQDDRTSAPAYPQVSHHHSNYQQSYSNISHSPVAHSDALKLAQSRILELEQELERTRRDTEELSSAAIVIKKKADNLEVENAELRRNKDQAIELSTAEVDLIKKSLHHKESELTKHKIKVEELEQRLKNDFKKIRVRERELENRLEIVKSEKTALLRSKDETILDLKRRLDQMQVELDSYRQKCADLNQVIEDNQNQFARTVKALRLALTNLEVKD